MTGDSVRDVTERVLHTFWQGALGSLPATLPLSRDGWEAAGWSVLIGGGSAVLALARGMVKARGTRRGPS